MCDAGPRSSPICDGQHDWPSLPALWFDALFKEHGLPQVLRTDNGTPFSGRFGVSSLSVWWVKLGITPEGIQRGKPTQNGRHERIHRTSKADAIRTAWLSECICSNGSSIASGTSTTPSDHTRRSISSTCLGVRGVAQKLPGETAFAGVLERPDVYVVRADGSIRMPGRALLLSPVLRGEPVAVEICQDDTMVVSYGPLKLGTVLTHGRFVRGSRARTHGSDAAAEDLSSLAE
jgi:hypothetical protein